MTSLTETDLLIVCREGAGRSQIGKAFAKNWFPGKNLNCAGFFPPQSGRTDVPPEVVGVVHERTNLDISEWPLQKLNEKLVTPLTIAVLLHPSPIPDYLPEIALGILLAYLSDPVGSNLTARLEVTATQLYLVNCLLQKTLENHLPEIMSSRDQNNRAIPIRLTDFEHNGGRHDPYSVRRVLTFDSSTRISSSDPSESMWPPEILIPLLNRIGQNEEQF